MTLIIALPLWAPVALFGTCVLAASHDPDLIDAADRVITLQRAR